MTAKELEEQLAAIANKAKALRDAGVIGTVTLGDVSFELASTEPAPVPMQQAPSEADAGNPLDDPYTYGGFVPQRRRPREEAQPHDNNEG